MKKLLLIFLIAMVYTKAFSQKINGDKSAICKILTKEHKCEITVQDISTKCDEEIITWGYRMRYTSTPLVAKGCCVWIRYYVEKDAGGSSYYRELFIPIIYIYMKNFANTDKVYYIDRWGGKGSRFDPQGGSLAINDNIRQIIKLIHLK